MKQQKATAIRRVLNQLYPDPPIPLNHRDIFTFLLSVVLSAQTTDGKVNDVTKVLFQKAPTPEILSTLTVAEVHAMIGPVGLSSKKAAYLVDLSKKILQDFDGKVPRTYEDLESLPGVGHKTASVIMSQVEHCNSST
jgi:endonuclease III